MKLFAAAFIGLVLMAGQAVAQEKAAEVKDSPQNVTSEKNKMSVGDMRSYSLGIETGNSLKVQYPGAINFDILARGVKDALAGKTPAMSEQEMRSTLSEFKAQSRKEAAEKNKKEGEAFLAGNKKKEGVVTLPSGLQYKVIREGTGRTPRGNEKVRVHYRGTYIDGTEFADTYKEGDQGPWIVYVDDVIPGWSEALKLMKVGSKWILYIPSNLAYGERGTPPNAVLIYELELLSIH